MSGCLRERTLLSLYEGEGAEADRAHVESCAVCSARYARLARDLERIERVLRDPPAPESLPRLRASGVRWLRVAAVLFAAVLIAGGGMWMGRPARQVAIPGDPRDDAAVFLGEVSAALFSPEDPAQGIDVTGTAAEGSVGGE